MTLSTFFLVKQDLRTFQRAEKQPGEVEVSSSTGTLMANCTQLRNTFLVDDNFDF